jgi:hypothetical protein
VAGRRVGGRIVEAVYNRRCIGRSSQHDVREGMTSPFEEGGWRRGIGDEVGFFGLSF